MPDIVIAGATYPDVPSILLPVSGGGQAQFYDMSRDLSWLGAGAEQIEGQFYEKIDTLDNTLYNRWTPSTTAKAIVAATTLSSEKFVAEDVHDYTYYIIWEGGCELEYTGTPAQTALPLFARGLVIQALAKRPSSWTNIESSNINSIVNQAAYTGTFLRYYGTTTGSLTYTWTASYGFYLGATAPVISSTTVTSPTITPKTPAFNARCSTNYFSTANAALLDQEKSVWWIRGSGIYRAKSNTFFDGVYKLETTLATSAAPSLPSAT